MIIALTSYTFHNVLTETLQRPHNVPQRLYSVHGASTAHKQLLQRVHGALTARTQRSHGAHTAFLRRAHGVLTAIIAFKIYLLVYILRTLFCEHSDLFFL